jgi:hypothetical protein
MSVMEILLPVFVQVLLSFVLLFWMAYYRVTLIRSGKIRPRDVALREPNWPPHVQQLQNAVLNQFELPVLFYALMALVMITRQADFLLVLLAWVFVILRVLHAYVHVTSNHMARRGPLFGAGAFVLAAMWLIFMLRIIWVY